MIGTPDQSALQSALSTAVDDFYGKVLGNPTLAKYFSNADVEYIKARQREWLLNEISHPNPLDAIPLVGIHVKFAISGEAYDLFVRILSDTLAQHQVPAPAIEALAPIFAGLRPQFVTA